MKKILLIAMNCLLILGMNNSAIGGNHGSNYSTTIKSIEIDEIYPKGGKPIPTEFDVTFKIWFEAFPEAERPTSMRYWFRDKYNRYDWSEWISRPPHLVVIDYTEVHPNIAYFYTTTDGMLDTLYEFKYQIKVNGVWSNTESIIVRYPEF